MESVTINKLSDFADDNGNVIRYAGTEINEGIAITFTGKNNTLIVSDNANIKGLTVLFRYNSCLCQIGNVGFSKDYPYHAFYANIHLIGDYASVSIGDYTTSTGVIYIASGVWQRDFIGNDTVNAEKISIDIGRDCMFSQGVSVVSTDWHPIFDNRTNLIINKSRSIIIGDHVWLGDGVCIAKGASIGSGSVVGARSVITGREYENNCVFAGIPAKKIKSNIHWRRAIDIAPESYVAHSMLQDEDNTPEGQSPEADLERKTFLGKILSFLRSFLLHKKSLLGIIGLWGMSAHKGFIF